MIIIKYTNPWFEFIKKIIKEHNQYLQDIDHFGEQAKYIILDHTLGFFHIDKEYPKFYEFDHTASMVKITLDWLNYKSINNFFSSFILLFF